MLVCLISELGSAHKVFQGCKQDQVANALTNTLTAAKRCEGSTGHWVWELNYLSLKLSVQQFEHDSFND